MLRIRSPRRFPSRSTRSRTAARVVSVVVGLTAITAVAHGTSSAQDADPSAYPRAADAVAFMQDQHDRDAHDWAHLCLGAVSTAWGGIDGHETAASAAEATRSRHDHGTPPAGAPVWWPDVGSVGHVALSAGDGYVWSNDIIESGRIDKVSIAYLDDHWGDGSGNDWFWSDDLGGMRLPLPPTEDHDSPQD